MEVTTIILVAQVIMLFCQLFLPNITDNRNRKTRINDFFMGTIYGLFVAFCIVRLNS